MMLNRSPNWAALASVLTLLVVAGTRADDAPPNCLIDVSARFVAAVLSTSIDRCEPIRDNILQADIHGTGHSVGRVTPQLVPFDRCAVIDLVMTARMDMQTIGYKGPARMHNANTADIVARKRVYLMPDGARWDPAQATNHTAVHLEGITAATHGPVRSAFVRRVANKRYSRDEALATQIIESHVNQRVAQGFDRDAAEQLNSANRSYWDDLRRPLERDGLFPDEVRTATSADCLFIAARLGRIAGSQPPDLEPNSGLDVAVRVHQSFLETAAQRRFGGKTYTLAQLREELAKLLGPRYAPRSDEAERNLSITFAAQSPVQFRLADDRVQFTIHSTRLMAEEREYTPMDIGADYRIELTASGLRAVRQGELQIYPPNHVAGRPLSSRQIAMRTLLKRHLPDVFPDRLEAGAIALPEPLNKAGTLSPAQARAVNGWLAIGLRTK